MMIIDNFSNCDNGCSTVINQGIVPMLQNCVYDTQEEALNAPVGKVELVRSELSGFIFNKPFDEGSIIYNENYQNEQANSLFFQEHLDSVLDFLISKGIKDKKVIEVGCGKGYFLQKMIDKGIDCKGFDPTFEGESEYVIKDFFTEKYSDINADVIVLRHTLEHIPNPFSFLHQIAKANNYKGYIYIEVPTFDWITEKKAFWDVFYEHCNYFTKATLGLIFENAEVEHCFGGQYLSCWADLSKIKFSIPPQTLPNIGLSNIFQKETERYFSLVKQYSQNLVIWGAGAKGSTFLNILDSNKEHIKYVIDINPKKQNKFIARTAHPIYSPEILSIQRSENILVMNENYLDEIKQIVNDKSINIFSL